MNLRRITLLAGVAVLILAMTSCGTARRASKDLGIIVSQPWLTLYGGFTDGYSSSTEISNGLGDNAAIQVIAMPFTTAYHTVKHAVWAGVHAADLILAPVYAVAEMHPHGPTIEPLDFYSGTPSETANRTGTDAQTGEARR